MQNEILFSEKQKFKQWWLWLILLAVNGFFMIGFYKQIICKQQFGDKPISNEALLIATVLSIILIVLFLILHLETKIKKDGIYVRLFPLHLKFKHYNWNEISKIHIRQYSPIKEYGGWGLRLGIFGQGTALNISGNKGLQIEFIDNKKLLIGTNSADELNKILNQIEQLNEMEFEHRRENV